jgi:hypothetical protein
MACGDDIQRRPAYKIADDRSFDVNPWLHGISSGARIVSAVTFDSAI